MVDKVLSAEPSTSPEIIDAAVMNFNAQVTHTGSNDGDTINKESDHNVVVAQAQTAPPAKDCTHNEITTMEREKNMVTFATNVSEGMEESDHVNMGVPFSKSCPKSVANS